MKLNGPKATTTPTRSQAAPGQEAPVAVEKSAPDRAPTGLRGASTLMNVGGHVALEADAQSEDLLKEFSPGLRGAAPKLEMPTGITVPRCEKPTAPGMYFMGWTPSDPSPRLEIFEMKNGVLTGGSHVPISDYGAHAWWGPVAFSREDATQGVTREQESLDAVPSKSVQRTLPYNEGSFKFECKHQSSAEDLHAAVGGYLLQQGGQFLVCSTDVAKKLRTSNQLAALGDGNFSELIRVEDLEPLPGKHLPKDFKDAVHLLTRPYIGISEAQYQQVKKMTKNPLTDIVRLKDGRQATFGEADGGYALMPLAEPI